ncbi:hypothetical protein LY78DRAFT_150793 [Colletotrichum sublineola]|nr:hypothetical protein LY78DRAFT_150793 [Colletotrichum sublineola]
MFFPTGNGGYVAFHIFRTGERAAQRHDSLVCVCVFFFFVFFFASCCLFFISSCHVCIDSSCLRFSLRKTCT